MDAIKINNLTKVYGKNRGIKNINLRVNEGEIYGFIGPNGAGKSTTIKTLLNFIFPTEGSGEILDKDIMLESEIIKSFTSYVPSDVKYYSDVRVKDILAYAESFFNNIDKEYTEELCKELDVEVNKKMNELSLGNKKKVAIVQALLSKPKIIILDEPTNGLDPLIQQKLFNILLKEKAKGTTIFLSSHNLLEVERFCDKVAIIKEGEIIDIIDIKNMERNFGKKITLKAEGIEENNIKSLSEKINFENNEFKFIYTGDINELLKVISKFKVENLIIEEVNLEDTFMDYYKEEVR